MAPGEMDTPHESAAVWDGIWQCVAVGDKTLSARTSRRDPIVN